MKLYEILLVEDFKTSKIKFQQQGATPEEIDQYINTFRALQQRKIISNPAENNIDIWAKQGWEKFKEFMDTIQHAKSRSDIKRKKSVNTKVLTLLDNETWNIVIPLTHETSCAIGKHTDWCISKPDQDYFHEYNFTRNTFIVILTNKGTNKQWAISYSVSRSGFISRQIFDAADDKLDLNIFKEQTGININDLDNLVKQHIDEIRTKIEEYKKEDPIVVINTALQQNKPNPLATSFVKNTKLAFHSRLKYALNYLTEPVPSLEAQFIEYVNNYMDKDGKEDRLETLEEINEYIRKCRNGSWPEMTKLLQLHGISN